MKENRSIKKTTKYRRWRDIVIEDFKNNPKEAEAYLELSLKEFEKDGDVRLLLKALRTVAEARGGLSKISRDTGLSRQSLYKIFSEDGNPTLCTMLIILHALGYILTFKRKHH